MKKPRFPLGRFLIEQRPFIALLVLTALVSGINPDFFSTDNLLNIIGKTAA